MKGTTSGLISLLEDNDFIIQTYAIEELIKEIYNCWPLVVEKIPYLINLTNKENFPTKKQVFKLISLVSYYQGNFEMCLEYSLHFDDFFLDKSNIEFTNKLVSYSIQKYIFNL